MKLYKIRDKETGLFSSGGSSPHWTKNGKRWSTLGYLHSHLNQFKNGYRIEFYKNAEVVEAEVSEVLTPVEEPKDYINKLLDKDIEYYKERMETLPDQYYYEKWYDEAKKRKALLNNPKQ